MGGSSSSRGDGHGRKRVDRPSAARLAVSLIEEAGMPPDRRGHATATSRAGGAHRTSDGLSTAVTGDEGFKKAEVTGGGVALEDVDPRTLESRTHKGLFLCGEMLDAFGPIGGHNFAWAWATGRAAGISAAR